MNTKFFLTTIGKKILVAITGLYLIVFLIIHLLGNLEIFSGPEAINRYGAMLREFPKILWLLRITLILSVLVHIYLTISLTMENRQKRPEKYFIHRNKQATFASRTMMITGLTVLFFVLYHLAHYTFGLVDESLIKLHDHQGRHNVYNMMIFGFRNPLVSGFYILAQGMLAFHLSHGISSAARTFGANKKIFQNVNRWGKIFAYAIALLYISIPLAVLFGFLTPI